MFTIYSADVTGNPGNCSYPHKHVILDEASLKAAINRDYVCAEYRKAAHGSITASFRDNRGVEVALRQIFVEQVLIGMVKTW